MKDYGNVVSARVSAAPALGGTKMYQVKISCKGKSRSMYKTKDDFKNVINMFKLVGAMAARKSADCRCEVCASCTCVTMVRACSEDSLDDFLATVLDNLRKTSRAAIQECATHKGVVQILMDFMGLSNAKYFCEQKEDLANPALDSEEEDVVDNDVDHPMAQCSLHRSLSEKFAARDSLC